MRKRGCGLIVQMLAIRPAPCCGAKAAVTSFTDALRAEVIAGSYGVALSVICLPAVDTTQPRWTRNHSGHEQIIPDPLFVPRLCADAV